MTKSEHAVVGVSIVILVCALLFVGYTIQAVKEQALENLQGSGANQTFSRLPTEFYDFAGAFATRIATPDIMSSEVVEDTFDSLWARCDVLIAQDVGAAAQQHVPLRATAAELLSMLREIEGVVFDMNDASAAELRRTAKRIADYRSQIQSYKRDYYALNSKLQLRVDLNSKDSRERLNYALAALGGAAAIVVAAFAHALRRARIAARDKTRDAEGARRRAEELEQRAETFGRSAENASANLSDALENLSSTARALLDDATQTERRCDQANAAAASSARQAEEVVESANAMSTSLEAVIERIRENAAAAENGAAQASRSHKAVEALSSGSAELDAFVAAIRAISQKTQRLSINARIEAARAGDSGKGFAVVAQEVAQLAAQAQDETDRLEARGAVVRAATGEAAGSLDEIVRVVEAMATRSQAIAGAIGEHREAAGVIATAAASAAQGAMRARGDVETVKSVAEATRARSQQVDGSASEAAAQAGALEQASRGALGELARA